MLIKRRPDIASSEITARGLYLSRRAFIAGGAALTLGPSRATAAAETPPAEPLAAKPSPTFRVDDPPTKFESATTYNNFYEFGVDKADP